MGEKKFSNFSVVKENSEIWKLRKEQKLKSKLQSNITTVLNLMTVLKCAFPACHRSLKKVPFCLSSRAESALLTCCRALRVPFFSNLTMPFFRAGGNTKTTNVNTVMKQKNNLFQRFSFYIMVNRV